MLVNLGIMTCIIQIPGEINAQEATIFEEEDYTLQLENYQKELDIDINEISYNSELWWKSYFKNCKRRQWILYSPWRVYLFL